MSRKAIKPSHAHSSVCPLCDVALSLSDVLTQLTCAVSHLSTQANKALIIKLDAVIVAVRLLVQYVDKYPPWPIRLLR